MPWDWEILQLVAGRAKASRVCALVMLGHREGLRVWDVSFVSNSALVVVSNPCSITHIHWYIDCHGCAVPSSAFFRKSFRAKQKVSFNHELLGLECSEDFRWIRKLQFELDKFVSDALFQKYAHLVSFWNEMSGSSASSFWFGRNLSPSLTLFYK